ncbi:MAG TPA: ATP-dependent DNA helicase UvrD2 [Gaiellaceae bacterium]|nr:ATP-dependent DNA helicase UvrD2 [Gaiellaceae bacterium]
MILPAAPDLGTKSPHAREEVDRRGRYGGRLDAAPILDGLNPEQRAAAEAVRGPLCILAGAGTGKTTTITRRIAWQVASGAFPPGRIVAVTFTDKAAGELRSRLRALGVEGVRASTFHSAALALLRHFRGDPGRILATKALLLRRIGNGLPVPYRFRPAGDLATEIEWAKNRRLAPETYYEGLGEHEPPIPPDLMLRVFREYERRKDAEGALDFEDLLARTVALLEEDEQALAAVRDRWRAFTVDEYQDVNLLQQALLDLWVGPRDDLCVVGDDYQSIYGFTGATARWLLELPERFPHARVVRLERNYRSSPQVLEFANRLVPRLGGSAKTLAATLPDGPEPVVRPGVDVAAWVREVAATGVPLEQVAVLVRTNARTTEFEEAFHEARIPFQGASLLARDAARQLLKAVRGARGPAAEVVETVAARQGLLAVPPEKLGEREQTRQADLARLVRLAEEFDGDVGEFVSSLHERFGESAGRGVHLLTLHRAKGLEWEAVALPRLEEGELPSRRARGEELEEERRLLYVGLTRARRHLLVTWSGKPSRFLEELGVPATAPAAAAKPKLEQTPAVLALKEWRLARARAEEVPAYVVFNDRTLAELVARTPRTLAELAAVPGIGPAKLERYGTELLAALARVA